jgi:hypothetical protein
MTVWTSYFRWFQERYDAIKDDFLKDGATECGPVLKPTEPHHPKSAPWRADWAVKFPDGKYFRVKESYKRLTVYPNVGNGEREHFSFHYGLAHKDLDARGFPKSNPAAKPPVADLRVDIDKDLRPHIHVGSVKHIYQDHVEGYVIKDADMFAFLEAVREHRQTKKPLTELLNIKVLD